MPGYLVDVEFFQDSEDVTGIHWYAVPATRPCLPVASFIEDRDWENLNGPRSPMDKGLPPGAQGEQWGPRTATRQPPRPFEAFTGHFCGTASQWAGDLRTDRPEDRGSYGCCAGLQPVLVCSCSTLVATVHTEEHGQVNVSSGSNFQREMFLHARYTATVCSCTSLHAGEGRAYVAAVCSCTILADTAEPAGHYHATVCSCTTLAATWTASSHYTASVCSCTTVTAPWTASAHYAATVCSCSTTAYTWAASAKYTATVCSCTIIEFTGTVNVPVNQSKHNVYASTAGYATAITITDADGLNGGVLLLNLSGHQLQYRWTCTDISGGVNTGSNTNLFNGQFANFDFNQTPIAGAAQPDTTWLLEVSGLGFVGAHLDIYVSVLSSATITP